VQQRQLPYDIIFPYPELGAEAVGDLPAGLDIHARTRILP